MRRISGHHPGNDPARVPVKQYSASFVRYWTRASRGRIEPASGRGASRTPGSLRPPRRTPHRHDSRRLVSPLVCKELLWFLSGSTNINEGLDRSIWNEWQTRTATWAHLRLLNGAGPEAGSAAGRHRAHQARPSVPTSHRERPNVDDVRRWRCLCHTMFQFYVSGGTGPPTVASASADLALGVPFNIASYSLLLSLGGEGVLLDAALLHPHHRRRPRL